ncbi:aldehyde dehydrogenase family protein [Luteibacter aegosomatis]|uniref:aldehyde dehydrogenase family protein n=1 Tax=Luteibacter aegosomatis TaxID=2911537 RepID=UPI001FFA6540|nr:aldehyde dehydrogenase family protein [Luteibacter aegosomatis]UPG87129.1 aldehyde dehydrogenase family protein [Luteibacter aegosomatis]
MHSIDQVYIDGAFVEPHGTERFELFNPATEALLGTVRLADADDARLAIAAARRAFPAWSRTTVQERVALLRRMHDAMLAHEDELLAAVIEEYGAPSARSRWMAQFPAQVFLQAIDTLENYAFERRLGSARVIMQPAGVVGLITPWNSDAGFICGKLATALAAGCTAVIKPSEMSALQTSVVMKALHEAGAPAGVYNIVTGRGDVVGAEIVGSPDVRKISFTGSTAVGKGILRAAADDVKRVTLELGGKSPSVILDDADFATAVPMAVMAGFMNSGQACIAGTRLLVPRSRLAEFEAKATDVVNAVVSGDPSKADTEVGPMVSRKQWERVQGYIRKGIEEGARLLAGGEGRPDGYDRGWLVRPTLFTDVRNDMTVAREEIFGPVLSIIAYDDEEDAIAIANDTTYGLQAYVMSSDIDRAARVAARIDAGRVLVNTLTHEPKAPFGGFKQSGLGREYGEFGLEAYLEPKAILGLAV